MHAKGFNEGKLQQRTQPKKWSCSISESNHLALVQEIPIKRRGVYFGLSEKNFDKGAGRLLFMVW